MQTYAIIAAALFAAGLGSGYGIRNHMANVHEMELQIESGKTLQSAADRANQVAEQLQLSNAQIDDLHDKTAAEIDSALGRNRALVERMRIADSHQRALSRTSANPTCPDRTATRDNIPETILSVFADAAAECDRVLSIARAGKQYAESIDKTMRQHNGRPDQ